MALCVEDGVDTMIYVLYLGSAVFGSQAFLIRLIEVVHRHKAVLMRATC